jgi:hypothetical protein
MGGTCVKTQQATRHTNVRRIFEHSDRPEERRSPKIMLSAPIFRQKRSFHTASVGSGRGVKPPRFQRLGRPGGARQFSSAVPEHPPFTTIFTDDGIDVAGRLTTPRDADDLISLQVRSNSCCGLPERQ